MPARFTARGYNGARLEPLMAQSYVLAEEVGDAARALQTEFSGFAALALARVCQSTHSATILSASGLIGDAMTVARTAVEIAIDLAYIALAPDPRVAMFMDHDYVRKLEFALAIDDLHGGAVDQAALAELKKRADEALQRHPTLAKDWSKGGSWAGASIRKRATEADRVRLYELLYRDMCDASHSGYGSLEYALVDLDSDPAIRYGNMDPDEGPAVLAAGALLTMVGTVVDSAKLDAVFGERSAAIARLLTV